MRAAGIHVCCGGIVGMGETREDRVGMLATLASLPVHPESVPINMLVRVPGTPLADTPPVDPLEFVRTIAVARIPMPRCVGAALGRARDDERRAAGAMLPRRRQFDLLRREAAHHAEPRASPRSGYDGPSRHVADVIPHYGLHRHRAGVSSFSANRETVAVRLPGEGPDGREMLKRTFKTFYGVLREAARWLSSLGVTHVAMEATGIYSMPVYHALIEHGEFAQVLGCNAGDVKNVPDRKTDLADAEWLVHNRGHPKVRAPASIEKRSRRAKPSRRQRAPCAPPSSSTREAARQGHQNLEGSATVCCGASQAREDGAPPGPVRHCGFAGPCGFLRTRILSGLAAPQRPDSLPFLLPGGQTAPVEQDPPSVSDEARRYTQHA